MNLAEVSQARRADWKLAGGASHRLESRATSALKGRRILAASASAALSGLTSTGGLFRWLAPPANFLARFQRRQRFLAPLLTFALALLLAGCGNNETTVQTGDRDQVLHKGNGTEPRDLDPHTMISVEEDNIMQALFEPLVWRHPETMAPTPGVAERWDISPDGKVFTFHLRKNARWSNGDPVTARDFAYSMRRALTPELAAEFAFYLYPIRGAEAFNTGKSKDFSTVGVEAVDDHTLKLTLADPTPYFMSLLTISTYMPVHRATVEKAGGGSRKGTLWTRPGNHVSNGPFTLSEWSPSKRITLRRNTNYWNAANVKLAEVRFYPIENSDTEERAFRAGQLHLTAALPTSKIASYKKDEPQFLRTVPYLRAQYIGCNVTNGVLANRLVRRALGLAIDREGIVKTVTRGGETPAWSFVAPKMAGYESRARLPFDPAAAKKALADAGFPDGKGFPKLQMIFDNAEITKITAEAIQQMWRATLGIEVGLQNMEKKVYLDRINSKDYELYLGGWTPDYPDPMGFLEMWGSSSTANYAGFRNADYDDLLAKSGRELDVPKRMELIRQAEDLLTEEAPILSIYHHARVYLSRPSVKGWHTNPLDTHAYSRVFLEAGGK